MSQHQKRQQARNNQSFQRAFAFSGWTCGEGVEGGLVNRAWMIMQLLAANLAKQNGIWDRAINTADKTKSEHDYGSVSSPIENEVRQLRAIR